MKERFPKSGIFNGGDMIGIIRYCRGYVKLRVWGYSPERFMNLCTNRGILIWGVCNLDGCYTMYMSLPDFFTLKEIVRKTKTKVAVLEKRGLPFLAQDVRRRKMFVFGVILCLFFIFFMSRFVWAIELCGNRMITDDELYDFLEQEGVCYGSKKNALDTGGLEKALREGFHQITWASVGINGTKVTVQVKENDLPSKEEQHRENGAFPDGADMVASADGTVVSILTRSGVPLVKAGDNVKKGDILISGLVPVKNDDQTVREYGRVVSDGDILIETTKRVHLTQPFSCQYKNYTGRQKIKRFITLGSRRILFPPGSCSYVRYDEVIEQEKLRLFGQIDVPVFTGKITYREYLPVDAVYKEESAKELVYARLEKIIGGLKEKGVQITQKDVKIVRKADGLMLQGSLTMRQPAAVLQQISEDAAQPVSDASGT